MEISCQPRSLDQLSVCCRSCRRQYRQASTSALFSLTFASGLLNKGAVSDPVKVNLGCQIDRIWN